MTAWPLVRCSNHKLTHTAQNTRPKLNPNPLVHLRKIPAAYRAPPCKSAFAQSINRTKMFHVKHFCKAGAENLTKWRYDQKLRGRRDPGESSS